MRTPIPHAINNIALAKNKICGRMGGDPNFMSAASSGGDANCLFQMVIRAKLVDQKACQILARYCFCDGRVGGQNPTCARFFGQYGSAHGGPIQPFVGKDFLFSRMFRQNVPQNRSEKDLRIPRYPRPTVTDACRRYKDQPLNSMLQHRIAYIRCALGKGNAIFQSHGPQTDQDGLLPCHGLINGLGIKHVAFYLIDIFVRIPALDRATKNRNVVACRHRLTPAMVASLTRGTEHNNFQFAHLKCSVSRPYFVLPVIALMALLRSSLITRLPNIVFL